MTTPKLSEPLIVDAHKRRLWVFLGYLLIVPLLISPLVLIDPFVPKGGSGEGSLVFSTISALIGLIIVIYQSWFSIRKLSIGECIQVHFATYTRTVDWLSVDAVFVERRYRRVRGVPVEVCCLNFNCRDSPISIEVAPELIPSILAAAKTNAPESCKVSEEIVSVRV